MRGLCAEPFCVTRVVAIQFNYSHSARNLVLAIRAGQTQHFERVKLANPPWRYSAKPTRRSLVVWQPGWCRDGLHTRESLEPRDDVFHQAHDESLS
jgi:hypothetical protein